MIDIHCHMLPNIDDGPESLEESLQMARLAVKGGITYTVVTPHIHPGRYDNDRANIREKYNSFEHALGEANIPLQLGMAAEVRISPEIMQMTENNRIPWLGKLGDYYLLLLELPHSHIPVGSDKLIQWCLDYKIRPVIAHPERNKDVIRNLNAIEPLVKLGCLLQVTAGSVAGNFGHYARKRARQLLNCGWVQFLASDAHNTKYRIPNLEPGRAAAAKIIGEQESWNLVHHNPQNILIS
jgi:protein-tyrosine phosphatase